MAVRSALIGSQSSFTADLTRMCPLSNRRGESCIRPTLHCKGDHEDRPYKERAQASETRSRLHVLREWIFGVRKPCLRLFSPQPCCGLLAGEARLHPPKAGAWLPHSKVVVHSNENHSRRNVTSGPHAAVSL